MPCVSVVVSGDFCRFKLALPSLLSMSKDEVKAAHSDFDRGPRGGGLRPEKQTMWRIDTSILEVKGLIGLIKD